MGLLNYILVIFFEDRFFAYIVNFRIRLDNSVNWSLFILTKLIFNPLYIRIYSIYLLHTKVKTLLLTTYIDMSLKLYTTHYSEK